jgi:hypothetical protein
MDPHHFGGAASGATKNDAALQHCLQSVILSGVLILTLLPPHVIVRAFFKCDPLVRLIFGNVIPILRLAFLWKF